MKLFEEPAMEVLSFAVLDRVTSDGIISEGDGPGIEFGGL